MLQSSINQLLTCNAKCFLQGKKFILSIVVILKKNPTAALSDSLRPTKEGSLG